MCVLCLHTHRWKQDTVCLETKGPWQPSCRSPPCGRRCPCHSRVLCSHREPTCRPNTEQRALASLALGLQQRVTPRPELLVPSTSHPVPCPVLRPPPQAPVGTGYVPWRPVGSVQAPICGLMPHQLHSCDSTVHTAGCPWDVETFTFW